MTASHHTTNPTRFAIVLLAVRAMLTPPLPVISRRTQIMCPMHHPNLVRLHGGVWNEGADKLCIVLELCANGSLNDFLQPLTPVPWELGYSLVLGAAKGLRYLHHELAEPLIHRDIKPDNIMVDAARVAKLADFGESRHFDTRKAKADADNDNGGDALTMTMAGSRLYMAPEVACGERYNESADTFSFALVLLSIAAGDIRQCCVLLLASYSSSFKFHPLNFDYLQNKVSS